MSSIDLDSVFQLTDSEVCVYKQKGYSDAQIEKVKQVIQMLSVDAKLFSGRTSSTDKMSRSTLLADLKACRFKNKDKTCTHIHWKRTGLDREFIIGPPEGRSST